MSWLNAEAEQTYLCISVTCRVPTPNVLVERRSLIKHIIHSSHFLCVPLRNVAVECTFIAKALKNTSSISTHIFHQTVPIRHRPVPNVFRCLPSLYILQLLQTLQIHPSHLDESVPACNGRIDQKRTNSRTGVGVVARKFRFKRSRARNDSVCNVLRSGPRGNVVVERRSETENIQFITVTCAVFQLPMSWLNAEAE